MENSARKTSYVEKDLRNLFLWKKNKWMNSTFSSMAVFIIFQQKNK